MLVACCNKHQVTVTMKEDLVVGHDVLYADNKIVVMECALKYFKVNFLVFGCSAVLLMLLSSLRWLSSSQTRQQQQQQRKILSKVHSILKMSA